MFHGGISAKRFKFRYSFLHEMKAGHDAKRIHKAKGGTLLLWRIAQACNEETNQQVKELLSQS